MIIAILIALTVIMLWIVTAENAVCINSEHDIIISELVGIPTENLNENTKYIGVKFDIAVPCGIYIGNSNFGEIKLLVGKYSGFNKQGYIYFNKKIINNIDNIINM